MSRSFSAVSFVFLLASGCSSGAGAEPASASNLGLPPWQGTDRDLFGDEIDPSALGIVPNKPARKDQTLWARAQQADIVGRVRVKTFTRVPRAGDYSYEIGLEFANQLLAPSKLDDRTFIVTVEIGDPAYGLVRAQDEALLERTFVGFVKRFVGADDTIANHFYLAADSAEVAAVVQEAVAIKEVAQ